jgi:hypothetical protein
MSLWSRLTRVFGPERQNDALSAPLDTLVEAPEASATPLGARPMITPWSATRLQRIFEDFERSPSFGSLLEARLARQCLAQFWLMAPVDQLAPAPGSFFASFCKRTMDFNHSRMG